MLNNIFKLLYLIVGVCIAIILAAIYEKKDSGRYQVSTTPNGTVIIDTRSGVLYEVDGEVGYITHKDGKTIRLQRLP